MRGVLPTGRLAGLVLLAILASLTEGLGLVMMVPVLQLASGESGQDGLGAALARWGLPADLPGLLAIFVVLVTLRAALVQARIVNETAMQIAVSDRLRARLFGALLHARWRFLSGQRQGVLMALLLTAVERAGQAVQFLLGLGASLVTLAAILGAAIIIAPLPSLALGAGGLVVLALYSGLRRRAVEDGERLGATYGAFHTFFAERTAALRMIKSFGAEAREAEAADAMVGRLRDLRLSHQRGVALGQFVLQGCAAAALALAVWLALAHWHTPLATLLPLVALFARSVPLLSAVQACWQQAAHNSPAFGELATVLAEAGAAAEAPAGAGAMPRLETAIALEAASLRFAGREGAALDEVTLAFPAGSTTFVTGPSGAGKSTLADLLAGLDLPDSGRVTVDGRALDAGNLAAWRAQVAYVQQDPVLFDASLRDNLLWAAPAADDATLAAALERASAGFVLALPQGLGTHAGSSGHQFSGGERQRIVLARALLRAPGLLILDEATSALDAVNEAAIAEAIAALRGELTIVIIGHRGALAALADRRIVLERGRVARIDSG